MADKVAKSDEAVRGVVDLQADVRWQERLADARSRRARTLKEKGRDDDVARKPRKPWEEETAVDHQTSVEPPTKRNFKIDFLDRMTVLKRVTGQVSKEDLGPNDLVPERGNNWYPGADDNMDDAATLDAALTDKPQPSPSKGEVSVRAREPVDNIFEDPNFGNDDSEPVISLLLESSDALPSSPSRPWLQRADEIEDDGVPPPMEVPRKSGGKGEKTRSSSLPRWIGLAVLVLVSIAVGPLSVYAPWQTRATGPATPFFGAQPALGITASFVVVPIATSAMDWRPASKTSPAGPLHAVRADPPDFVRSLKPFETLPQSDEAAIGIDLPWSAFSNLGILKSSPVAPRLTLSMFERISGDPTSLVALPPALASVSIDAIKPVMRPDVVPPAR